MVTRDSIDNPLEVWEIQVGKNLAEYRVLRYEDEDHPDTWLCAVKPFITYDPGETGAIATYYNITIEDDLIVNGYLITECYVRDMKYLGVKRGLG